MIGDSFTEGQFLNQSDLPIHKLTWYHWYYNLNQAMQIDTTARNVLLLETVERHLRERAAVPLNNPIVTSTPQGSTKDSQPQMSWLTSFASQIKTALFMQYNISERLEIVLFSHDFFLWFCELKASLNLWLFNRVAPTVTLSKNKQHLFVGSDTDVTIPLTYPFSPLTDAEVDRLVTQLNAIAARFQKAGFDKVILSVIPNKITLLEPDRGAYNHLIERVQQHPRLRLTIVDLYTPYSRMHIAPYAVGDAHWNCQGRQIWLDAVAKALRKNEGHH